MIYGRIFYYRCSYRSYFLYTVKLLGLRDFANPEIIQSVYDYTGMYINYNLFLISMYIFTKCTLEIYYQHL